jgi:hypothetical protein
MTRSQLIKVFLAALDELAEAPHYVGGAAGKPTLDCDTVLTFLLEQVHNWQDVPYKAIRGMFKALLMDAPIDDVERLFASISDEMMCAERCAAEHKQEEREAVALKAARKAVDAFADDPAMLKEFVTVIPLLAVRVLEDAKAAEVVN